MRNVRTWTTSSPLELAPSAGIVSNRQVIFHEARVPSGKMPLRYPLPAASIPSHVESSCWPFKCRLLSPQGFSVASTWRRNVCESSEQVKQAEHAWAWAWADQHTDSSPLTCVSPVSNFTRAAAGPQSSLDQVAIVGPATPTILNYGCRVANAQRSSIWNYKRRR